MNNIKDKVVIITGASSGLGEATARYLAKKGAKLVIGARRKDRLDDIAAEICADGAQVETLKVDVVQREQVEALIQKAISVFGRIDVLINNAGLMAVAPLNETKVDEWERMIDINIKGVLYGIAAALPVFEKQNSGHFINISSVAGIKVSSPGGAVYSGTKYAVRAISEGLRYEAGPHIRTTLILPGAINSELKFGSSDEKSLAAVHDFYKSEISSDAIARAIAYAIEQPADVDINEIVIRPTAEEF